MNKHNKQLKLVVKNGEIMAIYNDALIGLYGDATCVETRRASHVEPRGAGWDADLSPVGGPLLAGFRTRAEALSAEVKYLNDHIIK